MLKQIIVPIAIIFFIVIKVDASSCHGGSLNGSDHSNQHTAKKANAQNDQANVQTLCPVLEKSIDRTIYADWEGDENNTPKRVYLCCAGCVEKFYKKPAKYVRKLRKNSTLQTISKLDCSIGFREI